MGVFNWIGSKLNGLRKIGSKALGAVAGIGKKISSGLKSAIDFVEGIPVVGEIVQNIPLYHTGKSAVNWLGRASDLAERGAGIIGADSIVDAVQKGVGLSSQLASHRQLKGRTGSSGVER